MGKLLDLADALDTKRLTRQMPPAVAESTLLDDLQAGPQARLVRLLDTWATMDESTWAQANVDALYHDIMDLFRAHPEANGWYASWRRQHPGPLA